MRFSSNRYRSLVFGVCAALLLSSAPVSAQVPKKPITATQVKTKKSPVQPKKGAKKPAKRDSFVSRLLKKLPINPLQKVYGALRRWRTDEAEKHLKPLLASSPKNKRLRFLLGQVRYYQGKYKEAIKIFEEAGSPKDLKKNSTYISLKATYDVTKKFETVVSPHFRISFTPGKDKILIPYAVKALEAAYKRLGKLYDYHSPTKIRVEILEDSMDLAKVSPLTPGDIMRTGTIALCKYNRIMITTPRVLVRGYQWIDTLVHEYTHLQINRVAKGIPIWLHEGLARYSEAFWRQERPKKLSPYSETLLARAIKKNKLITFQQMHPSMAKLPSSKDAALAYAQVFSLMTYFAKRKGQHAIAKVLNKIQDGEEIKQAFEQILQKPFDTFYGEWKQYLHNSNLREFKGLMPTKKILKNQPNQAKQKKKKPKRNFWYRPSSPKALGKRFLRLGEMLRRRGRNHAALHEYKKAEKHWKNLHPQLQNKIAKTYFSLKKYKPALKHLRSSLVLYPHYFTTFYHLGRAYFGMKKYKEAESYFQMSNYINPFHPGIHRYLIAIYRLTKNEEARKREIAILQRLRQPQE